MYFTFVMERELFAIAAALRNIHLSMLKPPPRSTEVPVQANDFEPAEFRPRGSISGWLQSPDPTSY